MKTSVVIAALSALQLEIRADENTGRVLGNHNVILSRREGEFEARGREGKSSFAIKVLARCRLKAARQRHDLGEEDRDLLFARGIDQPPDVAQSSLLKIRSTGAF